MKSPLFASGHIVATPGALAVLEEKQIVPLALLRRHWTGDWGDLDAEDQAANDLALTEGTRLFSAYNLGDDTTIWIITEWDRSITTLLLPSEY
jgi:hypothetical protein